MANYACGRCLDTAEGQGMGRLFSRPSRDPVAQASDVVDDPNPSSSAPFSFSSHSLTVLLH